jgi:Cellulase (glycosyl hydrolase family 5)
MIKHLSIYFLSVLSILFSVHSVATAHDHFNGSEKKVACFLAADFPTVDAPAIDQKILKESLGKFNVEYCKTIDQLNTSLVAANIRVLVLPFGSAFPVDAWPAIQDFISRGGSLVLFGGYPFHQPVIEDHGRWILGTPQSTYAHRLLIGPADSLILDSSPFYSKNSRLISLEGSTFDAATFEIPTKVYELTVRFTTRNDIVDEIGSAGPRDAVLRPLVQIVNGDGIPVACPLLEIDRLRGTGAGGRWVLEPSDAKLNGSTITYCVERALEGASQIEAMPMHSCVEESGVPAIRINFFRPSPNEGEQHSSRVSIVVYNTAGTPVFKSSVELTGTNEFMSGEIEIRTGEPLRPGFYKAEVKALDGASRPNSFVTGFWVMDRKLMESGPRLSVSKDWLLKDGKTFPIIGTSYMAADAERKFLLEPNPYLWEKDFSQMEKLGVNFVRTGLWTGWHKTMLDPGSMDEGFLRSLDALVLTAARHNIVVCFNLFAFLPPANGGANPYLDPRAIEWQNAFVALISSRYKNVAWIHYDLINEPSYSPPDKIWKEIPIGDEFERTAWKEWVMQHHANRTAEISDDWRDGSGDMFSLPGVDELTYQTTREDRRPRKALDFELFTQDVLTHWAGGLRDVIHSAGGNQLVTLGQDEGGMSLRSSQQFHSPSVDYTSIHTWWLNDHLLWDVVSTKVPEKPSLVSETGLMRLESVDGEPWRSPIAAKNLLERKFAYAFQGRGAGAVEWCWNINAYQSTDNEVGIGLTRADGTMKIETNVIKEFAGFFKTAEPYLGDFKKDSIVLVIPDSKLFTGLPDAMAGVQTIVRVLAEDFGIVPTMLSEYKLSESRLDGVRLVIVPSSGMICDSGAAELFNASLHGTKVLFIGAVEGNEYGKQSDQFQKLGLAHGSRPVNHYEPTNWTLKKGETKSMLTFGSGKSETLRKSDAPFLNILKGNILQEPLPIDLALERQPLDAMLHSLLNYSGMQSEISDARVELRVLENDKSALVVCVNESSDDATREVSLDGRKFGIPVEAGRSRMVLINRADGSVIVATDGKPIIQR